MRCDRLGEGLAAAADGLEHLDDLSRHHVERCLRCQADVAQYRRLRRSLGTLRDDEVGPDAALLGEILDGVGAVAHRRQVGRRAAYLGGLAAATAAGVGSVWVLASRGRRPA